MKAVIHTEPGDASVLRLVDRQKAEPGPGEVRVRIMVSGVNPTDWKSRSRAGVTAPGAVEFVPNQDGAGIVDAVGESVEGFTPGDRVWVVLAAYERPASGTAQEYTVLPAERVFPLPDSASFELGASIGVPAITAYRALTVADEGPARLSPGALAGKVVLVAGGAGAVGHAAIQLARWAGAGVIATVSNDVKAGYATAAGAQHVVLYTEADAAGQIRAIAPNGVDIIVEVALDRNIDLDLAVIRPRGVISTYAFTGDGSVTIGISQNMGLNTRFQFVLLYTVGWHIIASAAADINTAIADGAMDVGVSTGLELHRFQLSETADAHRAVEAGAVGKVLIRVAE